jgi:hypothetical protein
MSQQAFQQLLKNLSPLEREKILKTAMEYGLSTNDPAWLILALNQSGLHSIEKAIDALNTQRKAEILAFKTTAHDIADAAMESAATRQLNHISDKLATTAQHLFKQHALKISTGWITAAATLGIAFFIATNMISYHYLKKTLYVQAYQDAYQAAADEQARASWANTETGKIAYQLAQVTDIKALATCQKPGSGWYIEKKNQNKVCFPERKNSVITGWRIPD